MTVDNILGVFSMNYKFNSMENYLHLSRNNHGKDEKAKINFDDDVLAAVAVIRFAY